jgi:rfaE bifunctional protein nucleotidyltransferase chain/domain
MSKIVSLSELAAIIAELKKKGKKVAQCHGCFDLLHIGHVKHFESAKKIADVLVVTVTPDRFVNKGPGRPAFPENLRLESIAALEVVDYVALNEWATAIETINLLKPDFYVKGPDYKRREEDITQNILLEEDAVRAAGGQLYITEDAAFSSSKIISARMSKLDGSVQSYISNLKKDFTGDVVVKEIEKAKSIRTLIIGDTIIDEYHYCTPLGKSSKSPTISTIFKYGQSFAGGVLAIANHISQFSEKVNLFTCLGKENSQEDLIRSKLDKKINSRFFYRADGTTNTKRRYLDTYLDTKLFEVTFMNDKRITVELEDEIINQLKAILPDVDMIVIADFGHGMITPGIIQFLQSSGKFLAINAQTNSNNYGFNYITKYNNANFISIDEKELRLPFGDNYSSVEELIRKLSSITHCNKILITLGQEGCVYFAQNNFYRAPAFATFVKDSVGAGDAVLSVTSLLAKQDTTSPLVPFIGNCVGAQAVEVIGNEHPVYKDKLKKYISYFLK